MGLFSFILKHFYYFLEYRSNGVNSFSFCLSENIFILYSSLKDIFAGDSYKLAGSLIISFHCFDIHGQLTVLMLLL